MTEAVFLAMKSGIDLNGGNGFVHTPGFCLEILVIFKGVAFDEIIE